MAHNAHCSLMISICSANLFFLRIILLFSYFKFGEVDKSFSVLLWLLKFSLAHMMCSSFIKGTYILMEIIAPLIFFCFKTEYIIKRCEDLCSQPNLARPQFYILFEHVSFVQPGSQPRPQMPLTWINEFSNQALGCLYSSCYSHRCFAA